MMNNKDSVFKKSQDNDSVPLSTYLQTLDDLEFLNNFDSFLVNSFPKETSLPLVSSSSSLQKDSVFPFLDYAPQPLDTIASDGNNQSNPLNDFASQNPISTNILDNFPHVQDPNLFGNQNPNIINATNSGNSRFFPNGFQSWSSSQDQGPVNSDYGIFKNNYNSGSGLGFGNDFVQKTSANDIFSNPSYRNSLNGSEIPTRNSFKFVDPMNIDFKDYLSIDIAKKIEKKMMHHIMKAPASVRLNENNALYSANPSLIPDNSTLPHVNNLGRISNFPLPNPTSVGERNFYPQDQPVISPYPVNDINQTLSFQPTVLEKTSSNNKQPSSEVPLAHDEFLSNFGPVASNSNVFNNPDDFGAAPTNRFSDFLEYLEDDNIIDPEKIQEKDFPRVSSSNRASITGDRVSKREPESTLSNTSKHMKSGPEFDFKNADPEVGITISPSFIGGAGDTHKKKIKTKSNKSLESNAYPISKIKPSNKKKSRDIKDQIDKESKYMDHSQSVASGKPTKSGQKPVRRKVAHNEIEKRYRSNINNRIRDLKNAVPALANAKTDSPSKIKCSSIVYENEDLIGPASSTQPTTISGSMKTANNPNFAESSKIDTVTKLNKATILSKATEYIYKLRKSNYRLKKHIELLTGEISSTNKGVMTIERILSELDRTMISDPPIFDSQFNSSQNPDLESNDSSDAGIENESQSPDILASKSLSLSKDASQSPHYSIKQENLYKYGVYDEIKNRDKSSTFTAGPPSSKYKPSASAPARNVDLGLSQISSKYLQRSESPQTG
ncbi:putative transcription factor HMS1 [Smittium mucronatum]|uniref:Putative transcription factor HMS1 n=1 Tax=Smittium mucronatum TaxID=133383 RepID=A0A1R0GRF5_9FUNG|nr:putative transcription factor HMS1 [Smittium mucronatum]